MKIDDVRLFLATASGGSYCREYLLGCVDTVHAFKGAHGNLYPEPEEGLYVEHNRNVLTAKFLASGATHMLSVDTDMGWRARHVRTLLEADKDVVCGKYFAKQLGEELVIAELTGERQGPLERATVVPGGFLLVTRKAILQLQAHRENDFYKLPTGALVPALWAAEYRPREACYRDDGAFSKRCRDAGVDMWLHHGVVVTHYGTVGFGPHPDMVMSAEQASKLRAVS